MTPEPRHLQQRLHMRQLRLVRAISEHGGLSAAARSLRLSQPALTKALQELERLLQVNLFERLPQGTRPTAAGRVLIAFADRTLAELDRLSEALDRLASPDQALVVLGALPVTAAGLLPLVVAALRVSHPQLELRLVVERSDPLLSKLLTGEVDLVLGRLYAPELPDGLQRQVMYDEPLAVMGRVDHPLLRRSSLQPSDLVEWDIVLPTFGQRLGREVEHALEGLDLHPSPRMLRSSSNLLIRELLLGSDTLAVAPRMLMAGDLVRRRLAVAPLELAGAGRPAGLITSPSRPLGPSGRRVMAAVERAVRELARDAAAITSVYGGAGNFDGAVAG